jgi:predicted TIM-barrel fold metal-dependent hydrolase
MTHSARRKFFRACICCTPVATAAASVSRRDFLAGGTAALTLGAFAASTSIPKAAAQAKPHRIDVHHHISPPTWIEAVKKANRANPPMANWSAQKSLEDMDKAGIATVITSPTTPQVKFLGEADAARITRESNEYAKKLGTDHPGRFRMFGMLPLPHVDASLKEIAYALDTLNADGICMLTSYDDKWLGHAHFAPVMEELNRRKAVVYTHPSTANCCVNLVADVQDSVVEFGTDTARTIASLVLSGTTKRFPDIKFIFSHGGGTLTSITERFALQPRINPKLSAWTPETMLAELRRFHYDTAQAANPVIMAALTKLVPTSQIVYGTDYPYRTGEDHVKGLAAIFNADDLRAIDRENAVKLMPQLGTA